MNKVIWKPVNCNMIVREKYIISSNGEVRDTHTKSVQPMIYKSSNGYDFVLLDLNDDVLKNNDRYTSRSMLFRLDLLIALTFISVPKNLLNQATDVIHINNNTRDCHISNLKWCADDEVWKTITFPGIIPNKYEISNHGHIRLKNDKSFHPFHLNHKGYVITTLSTLEPRFSKGRKKYDKSIPVHRLVAYTFYGESDLQVNHINGIKTDNDYKNLEYITCQDNCHHAIDTGLKEKKINDDEIDMVYKNLEMYRSTDKVYDKINVLYPHITKCMIKDIKGGRYDQRVDFNKHKKLPAYRLHTDEIDLIRDILILTNGDTKKAFSIINKQYPFITHSIIRHIKHGKTTYQKSLKYNMSFNMARYPFELKRSR